MKIVYRLEALADLNNQLSHIAKENPTAAGMVGQRIQASVSRLEFFPYSGRKGIATGTLELVVPGLPFIVIYRVTSFVEIVAVFHARQDRSEEDIL